MKVYGALERAQVEAWTADPGTPPSFQFGYNTTDLAWKMYVNSRWEKLLGSRATYRALTSNTTLTENDEFVFGNASGGAFTITLPSAVTFTRKVYQITRTDNTPSIALSITSTSGTVGGKATYKLMTQDESLFVISDGTNWLLVEHGVSSKAQAWTPTGSWVSNTTYTAFWWRRGDRFNADIQIQATGAPTSASLTITLLTGITIDTAKMNSNLVAGITPLQGTAAVYDTSVPENYTGFMRYSSTTVIAVYKDDGDATTSVVNATAPMTFATGDYIWLRVRDLPVVDWEP
jgi:hypothetical protein